MDMMKLMLLKAGLSVETFFLVTQEGKEYPALRGRWWKSRTS